jgi:serine/threonine-protein kinase RsbW
LNLRMNDEPTKLTVEVRSEPEAIDEPRQRLLEALREHGYCDDDVFAAHLALQEAFYNAIKHGNKLDSDKKVRIDCVVTADRIEISMTDAGSGFDPGGVPDPRVGENLYKPQGRGLLLMRSYMDVVEFNAVGNTVRMVRYRHKTKNPAACS